MKRQVERAITQVLGRATGNDPNVFMNALNSAFPTTHTADGSQVAFTPARSVVSLYRADGPVDGAYSSNGKNGGYAGTISAWQANLYRQATVIIGDAVRVLNGLMPFVPEAESDQVEALRALIRAEITALMEEFGRVDEPRNERVQSYFSALRIHIASFGRRAFLDNASRAATVEDEAQVTGFELLGSYVRNLSSAWKTYLNKTGTSSTSFSLSQRVERANTLLPVIAQVNADFEAAMDSVGFAESERRSVSVRLTALAGYRAEGTETIWKMLAELLQSEVDSRQANIVRKTQQAIPVSQRVKTRDLDLDNLQLQIQVLEQQKKVFQALADNYQGGFIGNIDDSLPDITIYDLTEWVDRYTSIEGPASLADAGQYGLDFVTDQADRLFWVIVPVVAHLEQNIATTASASPSLELILSNERVRFALNNLLGQMNALADLAVPGGKANLLTA